MALYLLYLQVQLYFLAGLVFALLLIPVNRVIANRIGVLSTAMMTQKDARVNVRALTFAYLHLAISPCQELGVHVLLNINVTRKY